MLTIEGSARSLFIIKMKFLISLKINVFRIKRFEWAEFSWQETRSSETDDVNIINDYART